MSHMAYTDIANDMRAWIGGPTGFLAKGTHLCRLTVNTLGNGETIIVYRVHKGNDDSLGTIVVYLDEENQMRSAMYHGDDGLFVTKHANSHGDSTMHKPGLPVTCKHEMSIHTARALGTALGMWAIDQAGSPVDDCVYVEESDVWSALHHEWFGSGSSDGHVNEGIYHTCFTAMYAAARNPKR